MTIAPDRPQQMGLADRTLLSALLAIDVTDDKWRDRAACKDAPTDLFYPEREDAGRHAVRYCWDCPVRFDCLAAAFANGEHGIWGGWTAKERAMFRHRVAL
jgi:hypothetical protein